MLLNSVLDNMKSSKLLFLFIFLTEMTFAQTVVSGGIYQNTIWTSSGSPYLMSGSVVVFPGKTLTIEPGVEVLVTPDFSGNTGNLIYLEVRGTLIAIGTDQAPIAFRPNNTSNPGFPTWMGIKVKGSQGGAFQLDRFRLSHTLYGIYNDIVESGITYNFTNCQFKNNQYAVQLSADMVYQNCLFEENGVGQAAQVAYGSLTADNCQFINNFCSFTWSNNIQVSNCMFQGNGNNIVGSPGTLTNCQFIDNDFGLAEAYGHTLLNCYFSANGVGIDNTGGSIVSNCTFENNELALRVGDGSIITNNQITNNVVGLAVVGANPSTTLIADNIICSNALFNLQNLTDKNFEVNANCFCTSDSAVVENFIFDGYDDITKGLVNYALYDDSCETILDYIIKVNLISAVPETQSVGFKVLQHDVDQLLIFSDESSIFLLLDIKGMSVHKQSVDKGKNLFYLPTHAPGIYFLKDVHGKSIRLFLN